MAVETEEQREARLQRMRANQSDRLAAETEEQREARLQRMRANQSDSSVSNENIKVSQIGMETPQEYRATLEELKNMHIDGVAFSFHGTTAF